MKEEYDFSKAERGKFYRPGAKLNLPIYLEEDVREYAVEKARSLGVAVGQFVGDVLKSQAEADGYFPRSP